MVLGTVVMQVVSSVNGPGVTVAAAPLAPSAPAVDRSGSSFTRYPCAHFMGGGPDHWGFNAEDAGFSSSVGSGYATALARLTDEARALGAHGVVGVRVEVGELGGGWSTWTFRAVGTAVVHAGSPTLPTPFTTNASGPHLERLVALGMAPVTLVSGVGACYVRPNCQTRGDIMTVGRIDQIPQALGIARGRARAAVRSAARLAGHGVVNTEWADRRLPAWGEDWIQTVVALGTVVRRFGARQQDAAPQAVVPLNR